MNRTAKNDLAQALAEARQHDPELIAEVACYCENPKCCIREVDIQVKEFQGQRRVQDRLTCPACQQPMGFYGLDVWST